MTNDREKERDKYKTELADLKAKLNKSMTTLATASGAMLGISKGIDKCMEELEDDSV